MTVDAKVRALLGRELRSLVLFGSCLSPATQRPGSIPDAFAVVDDLAPALAALGVSKLGRRLARGLPPATLRLDDGGVPVAKLNVIDAATLQREGAGRTDLYLAGRLAKRTECVFTRDDAARVEIDGVRAAAREAVARLALVGLPRRTTIDPVLRRCVSLSYDAEPRPEKPAKIRALYDAFADWYPPRFLPLLYARARALGIGVEAGALVDERPDAVRRAEQQDLNALLRRSWLRAAARWPKGIVLYRGWFPYLVGKLQRAWAF